jgi:hypothetical protein
MSGPEVLTGEIVDPLNDAEYADLEQLETTISTGLATFLDVGAALAEIKERRLYRQNHSSFDAYCRNQWEMGKSKAYALIQAATIIGELSGIPDTPLPANAAQAEALAPLAGNPEAAAAAMQAASADGPATAASIADEVAKATGPTEPDVAPPPPPPADVPDPEPDPEVDMDIRQARAAEQAHRLAEQLSRFELVHEKTIRLMEARCKRWRDQ